MLTPILILSSFVILNAFDPITLPNVINEQKPAVNYIPDTYPNSLKDYKICGLSQPGYICDPNYLLGTADNRADKFDSLLVKAKAETACSCNDTSKCAEESHGFTISFALVENIISHGLNNTLSSKKSYDLVSSFTKNLRQKQRRGQCNDDILIVIAINIGYIYTDMSNYTSTFYLNSTDVEAINSEALAKINVSEAVTHIISEYKHVLQGFPRPVLQLPVTEHSFELSKIDENLIYCAFGGLLILLILLLITTITACYCCLRRKVYSSVPQISKDEISTVVIGNPRISDQFEEQRRPVISLPANAVKLPGFHKNFDETDLKA